MDNKTAIELVRDALKALGADGLCGDDCGCGLDDLAPCCGYFGACEPAKAVPRHVAREYGFHECGDVDIVMLPLSAKILPKMQCDGCGKHFIDEDLFWTGTRHLCGICYGDVLDA